MEIIIKISDGDYERLKLYKKAPFSSLTSRIYEAVANGTVVPKGHGRLIDVERLYDDFESMDYDFEDAIEYAPTIIEADKAESEGDYD